MNALIISWITRRWIRKAQRSFDSRPFVNHGLFNTAGFQSAVRDSLGVMPPSEFAQYLLRMEGAKVQPGGAHWTY